MTTPSPVDPVAPSFSTEAQGYRQALIRSLRAAEVKYVRCGFLDVANNPRIKCIPLSHLVSSKQVEWHVQFASIIAAGLPSYGDFMLPDSGLDARGTLVLQPDFGTLRVLPYAPTCAMLMGNLQTHPQRTPSPLCARSLLQRIVKQAAVEHGIGISVGSELEVTLFRADTNQPVDETNFAHCRFLNEQEQFLSELHDQLLLDQDIDLELIHVESGPGQIEVVLRYCRDPVQLADRAWFARETISALARKHGRKAVFLPKIHPMKAGSGCHLHLSLYDIQTGRNLFPVEEQENDKEPIGALTQSFMEGILCHFPALMGLTLPTTNSMRRVGPGCWTGSTINWAYDDKESALRVVAQDSPDGTTSWNHFEYKLCDHTANLHLALAGIIACGLDGIRQDLKLRPHQYHPNNSHNDTTLPQTVQECLRKLREDELLSNTIPKELLQGFLAIRRAEAERAANMTVDEELQEALRVA